MSILKLHPANINQLKGHIKNIGPAVIHGDGNIYPAPAKDWTPASGTMNHSYNNATFSNPDREEAKYFKQYDTVGEVPGTVEELEKELIANKFETAAKNTGIQAKPVTKTFDAYEEPVKEPKAKKEDAVAEGEKQKAESKKAKTEKDEEPVKEPKA